MNEDVPFEDVVPIEYGDIPASHVSFTIVYQSVVQLKFETLRSELSQGFFGSTFVGGKKNRSCNLEACFLGIPILQGVCQSSMLGSINLGSRETNILYLCKYFF